MLEPPSPGGGEGGFDAPPPSGVELSEGLPPLQIMHAEKSNSEINSEIDSEIVKFNS